MNYRIVAILFFLLGIEKIKAQEEELNFFKKIDLRGSLDTYFKSNLADNSLRLDGKQQSPATSFADKTGFNLGMASLIFSYNENKIGFVADFVFGPRGEAAVFNSQGSSNIINQLYVNYEVNDKITLTLGNFNTYLGYEVISPIGNFNYSTSYLFSYGPFSHTGLKADLSLSEDLSLMIAIMNPTDQTETNLDDQYSYGFQLGYKGQFLNYLGGIGYSEIDFTGGFDVAKSFYLGVNAAYTNLKNEEAKDTGFYGVALYPQYSFSNSFDLGMRTEYFVDRNNFTEFFGEGESTNLSFTLTGSYTKNNIIAKSEVRFDDASQEVYLSNSMTPSRNLASLLVAVIYKFE